MPDLPTVTILDWGKPDQAMVVKYGSDTISLKPKDARSASIWDQSYVSYATNPPRGLHLGFYGYVRICNVLCLAKCGLSIFDLSDWAWRDGYDDQVEPLEAVNQVLADNDYPADLDELDNEL